MFRKLGSIPEEDRSFRVKASHSTKQFSGKRRTLLLQWKPERMSLKRDFSQPQFLLSKYLVDFDRTIISTRKETVVEMNGKR